MSRMKICPKCGAIAEWDSYFGGTRCTRCDFVEKPKPTNYDRIISKTPEELAMWLEWLITWLTINTKYVPDGGWLAWLQKEADND